MSSSFDTELVFIDQHRLLGTNYYWRKRDLYQISEDDLRSAGLPDERTRVHKEIIKPLQNVDRYLTSHGYRLYISEGYRPPAVYKLIYQKRIERFGQEQTDRLINMESMPHATGKTVDVALMDARGQKELDLRSAQDGIDGLFIDFYKDKTDASSAKYQQLQELLLKTMLSHGFGIGPRKEYFHFSYKKEPPL